MLISLLSPPSPETDIDHEIFSPASDALQEIMTRSSLAGGAGVMTLTLPLLVWVDTWGPRILQSGTSCALLVLLDTICDILMSNCSRRSLRALSLSVQAHCNPRRSLKYILCYQYHLTTAGSRFTAYTIAAHTRFPSTATRLHCFTWLLWCRRRGE